MMQENDRYGVIVLLYEFLLSVFVTAGMIWLIVLKVSPEATTAAITVIMLIVNWWFQRRNSDNYTRTIDKQSTAIQTQVTQANQANPIPTPPTAPTATPTEPTNKPQPPNGL